VTTGEKNTVNTLSEAGSSSENWPGKTARGIGRAINVVAAMLTLAVLSAAILLPPWIGRGGTPAEQRWQVAALVLFVGGLFAIYKKVGLSLFYLTLACAFFFASCVSNFHWKGG
jgi:hypothetical protein